MPEHTPDRLELLLRSWGRDQRLDDERAAQILRAVVAAPTGEPVGEPVGEPAGLPVGWWQGFGAQLAQVMTQATQVPGAGPAHVAMPGVGLR